jgi:hypothetical protein
MFAAQLVEDRFRPPPAKTFVVLAGFCQSDL